MNSTELIFTNSPWWIAIAILVGIGYALLLYSKNGPWSASVKKILFVLRALAISTIAFLLINPLLRSTKNTTIKPLAVLLLDNSSSIPASIDQSAIDDAFEEIKKVKTQLVNQGFEVKVRSLDKEVDNLDSVKHNFESSNLTKYLTDLKDQYDGREIALSVLMSDGIYNLGLSPDYQNFPMPIYTVGLGDTIPKKDLILKNIRYNKIAYLDNQFPLEAEILQNGFSGETARVSLRKNGKVIDSQNISFDQNTSFQTVRFITAADKEGLQRYAITIGAIDGEQSKVNNLKDVYVDVISNKDKILILASSPHPDIKAIKQVLETNKNYEVFTFIPGVNAYDDEDYSLVIAHQPFAGNSVMDRKITELRKKEIPIWHILGKRTDLQKFNETNSTLEVTQTRGQFDKVGAVLNNSFGKFTLEDISTNTLLELPPINVPYGEYRLKSPAEIILKQRIGSIESDRPLLLVNNRTDIKEAVMLGTGFWSWKIMEASRLDETVTFNNIFAKLIQFLSTKEDKRKFRVVTSQEEYNDSENVIFYTETYNNIYEKIFDIPVTLKLTNELGESNQYAYITSKANAGYKIGGLDPGAYRYVATTDLNGKKLQATGGFSVVKLQIESVNLTADFNLLKRLSDKSGGQFYTAQEIPELAANLQTKAAQGVITSEDDYSQIIELRWVLLLIVALISAEWFIRKYSGGY